MFFLIFSIVTQFDNRSLGFISSCKECFIVRNDTLVYRIEKSIFINSESAREQYGTVVIPIDGTKQKIKVLYARTISSDGDTILVSPNAINLVADKIVEEYPFLSNRKELHISFLSIKKGSKLEYAVEIEESPFLFLDGIIYFQEELVTDYREIRFYLPQDLTFNYKCWVKEGISISENVYDSLDCRVYVFYSKNIHPIPGLSRWEGNVPLYLCSSFLMYTTFTSWDSLTSYLSHSYLGTEANIRKERIEVCKIKALCDNISSPEFEPLIVQGYVPLDYERAVNSFKMTFPEEIYRVIHSFEGLMPAFVLKYGLSIDNTPPSLTAIESIILFDGKSFFNPFRNNSKPAVTDFAGFEVVTFDSNRKVVSKTIENLYRFELKVVLNPEKGEAIFEEIIGRLPDNFQLEDDLDQVHFKIQDIYTRYFGLIGHVKRIKLKLKYVSNCKNPVRVSGKIYFTNVGYKVDKYYVIELPNPDFLRVGSSQRGRYIWSDEELGKRVAMEISVPHGYKLVYLPVSFEITEPGFNAEIKFYSTRQSVIISYESSFRKRYLTNDEVSSLRQALVAKGQQGGRMVIVFEKKN